MVEILKALSSIDGTLDALSSIGWVAIVAIVIWKLFPSIKEMVKSRGINVEIGNVKLSVQEATAQFEIQIRDLQDNVSTLMRNLEASGGPQTVAQDVRQTDHRAKKVLWVDDVPSNNAIVVSQLRDKGIQVDLALSTKEALQFLEEGEHLPGVLITDMGRVEDNVRRLTAGLTLARNVRPRFPNLPIVFCTTAASVRQNRTEIEKLRNSYATNSMVKLLEILKELGVMET